MVALQRLHHALRDQVTEGLVIVIRENGLLHGMEDLSSGEIGDVGDLDLALQLQSTPNKNRTKMRLAFSAAEKAAFPFCVRSSIIAVKPERARRSNLLLMSFIRAYYEPPMKRLP